ncbi:glycosyltransferase [Inquilinus sp. KBS0705]|nr:glycosyltransferase [Inquilinus sp. KBS0705]
MKVLLSNSYYYPAFVGGAELSVKLLAEGLVNAGHQVYVLTTGLQDELYRVNGVTVISIKQQNIYNGYNAARKSPVAKIFWHLFDSFNLLYHFKISAILKRIQPDIAHTNSIQGFSPMLWFTIKAAKIPLVHSMRDYYILCHKCNMYNGKNCERICAACETTSVVKRNFLSLPDRLIAISEFILDKYTAFVPEVGKKAQVIYNAVAAVNYKPTVYNRDEAVITFGYIGRLEMDKGVDYMADELAALSPEQKKRVKLLLAGKGSEPFIQQLKQKLTGINYEFLGVVKPENFYQQVDVLLVPALWNEPFGRIVIEALSYSVPVCQSDRGGLKELYDPSSSWLFSPESGHLTSMVKHIIDNRSEIVTKRQNCAGQLNKFSVENYIDKHTQLYNAVITKLPSSATSHVADGLSVNR